MKKKKSTLVVILIIAIILILLVGVAVISYFRNKIAPNPAGTIGNTAGNLNNSGLFCEHEGKVYFSNVYDHNSLYCMDASGENLKKINDVSVRNILAGGKYLYYFRYGVSGEAGMGSVRSVNSFNRCELDGSNTISLAMDVVTKAQLVNDYLYLLAAGEEHPEFYKMNTDKSNLTHLADYEINPACAENGVIYYNGTQSEHYLYGLDTTTDIPYEIWRGNIWYPVLKGDYVYYMDVAENYRLCRYSLSQDLVEVLTNERVDCFNVAHGYIYYQTNGNAPALKWMYEDGSGVQTVAEGICTNINMTSQFVYFQKYGDDDTMYQSYLGSGYFQEFTAAKDIVSE